MQETQPERGRSGSPPIILVKFKEDSQILSLKNELETIFKGILNKKNQPPLIYLHPLDLVSNRINENMDGFIFEEIQRIAQRRERNPEPARLAPSLELAPRPAKYKFRSATGLIASVGGNFTNKGFTINGESIVLPEGKLTTIDFLPGGRRHLDRAKMTDSIAKGIQGVVELIEAVDQGRFDAGATLIGQTNINMALIAQRLGFVIVDQDRTTDGNINDQINLFTVVGKLEDVRERVEEYARAGTAQRLERRNQRQQRRLQPAIAR